MSAQPVSRKPRPRQFWLRWAGILIVVGLLIELVSLGSLRSPIGFLTFAFGSGTFLACGALLYLRSQLADTRPQPHNRRAGDRPAQPDD